VIRENPMGETYKDAYRLDFDRKVKVEFHGTKVTSDAGLLAYRELDDVLGLTATIDSELRDIRTGKNTLWLSRANGTVMTSDLSY
jgi:hypothetical protein